MNTEMMLMSHSNVVCSFVGLVKVLFTSQACGCPLDEDSWNLRREQFDCSPHTTYHCIITNNGVLELCTYLQLIRTNRCLVGFSKVWKSFLTKDCEEKGCPMKSYLSNETYKYPICFHNILESSSYPESPSTATTSVSYSESEQTVPNHFESRIVQVHEYYTSALILFLLMVNVIISVILCPCGRYLMKAFEEFLDS